MTDTDTIPDPIAADAPTPDTVDGDTVREPGTGLHDTVAVTHDGAVYCIECAAEEYVSLADRDPRQIPYGGPVLRSHEWDCPGPSCGNCHRRIASVNILHYGDVCGEYCTRGGTPEEWDAFKQAAAADEYAEFRLPYGGRYVVVTDENGDGTFTPYVVPESDDAAGGDAEHVVSDLLADRIQHHGVEWDPNNGVYHLTHAEIPE